MKWIDLTEDRDYLRALANMVMNYVVHKVFVNGLNSKELFC
jgi:hypothetical protein